MASSDDEKRSTADSAEAWLNKKSAELRERIAKARGESAAQNVTDIRSDRPGAAQPQLTPSQAEDAAVFAALNRINKRER